MPEEVPEDALVVRFKPVDPHSVYARAAREHRRVNRYAISVFADGHRPGEMDEDVIRRLLAASELAGLDPSRNRKYWLCAAASELTERGFFFFKDGDEGEVPEHFSVDLGRSPTISDVERFLEVVRTNETREL